VSPHSKEKSKKKKKKRKEKIGRMKEGWFRMNWLEDIESDL
jgi:hypothetical protein